MRFLYLPCTVQPFLDAAVVTERVVEVLKSFEKVNTPCVSVIVYVSYPFLSSRWT